MHIGALIDLGVPEIHLQEQLSKLSVAGEFTLHLSSSKKMGITGTLATVELHAEEDSGPPLRHMSDISELIHAAQYSTNVTTLALGIFQEIAVAEAKVHGTTPDLIHFHEVGATDSIVDIVAAAICLDYLDPDSVYVTTVEMGAGMVKCAHGLMPVPAPATAEILQDIPCSLGGVQGEATTPTGAAILKSIVTDISTPKDFLIQKVGYGIGQKDFEVPNVLRVMIGESAGVAPKSIDTADAYVHEEAIQIECNIDDMSPEAFQPLVQGLFSCGAMDVSLSSIIMKKSRPGQNISVLCSPELKNVLIDYLFENSTTIGVREYAVKKTLLSRENMDIPTSFGSVPVKVARLESGERRWKVEFEAVRNMAEKQDMDYLKFKGIIDSEVEAALKRLFPTL